MKVSRSKQERQRQEEALRCVAVGRYEILRPGSNECAASPTPSDDITNTMCLGESPLFRLAAKTPKRAEPSAEDDFRRSALSDGLIDRRVDDGMQGPAKANIG